jgi:hypothetical protein
VGVGGSRATGAGVGGRSVCRMPYWDRLRAACSGQMRAATDRLVRASWNAVWAVGDAEGGVCRGGLTDLSNEVSWVGITGGSRLFCVYVRPYPTSNIYTVAHLYNKPIIYRI